MFDCANTIVNKLFFHIRLSSDEQTDSNVVDTVIGILYRHICTAFQSPVDWRTFVWGGTLKGQNNILGGLAASGKIKDERIVWSTKVHIKDVQWKRRTWTYYLGLRQISDEEIYFSYAKCCYDYMAGSLTPPKPLPESRDTFPDCLLNNPELQCSVGGYIYPASPLELSQDNLQAFLDILYDKRRSIPLMLITCPDVIVPEKLYDLVYGNIILFWCIDSHVIHALNATLPRELYTPWDTVRLFMPEFNSKAFHPTYTYDDITRMGIESFVVGIRQAYCRSMRSDDRKQFPMPEDIFSLKSRSRIAELNQMSEDNRQQFLQAQEQLSRISEELSTAKQETEDLRKLASPNVISEYESLLNDTMNELEKLKKGIADLSTCLYSTMGKGFAPNGNQSIAILEELSHAIYTALSCASSRH